MSGRASRSPGCPGARASSSPDNRKMIRQSPRVSAKSDRSAGNDIRGGGQASKLNLTFADAVVAAPAPEEKKVRERVEAGKRRNKNKGPKEGKAGPEAGRFCDATCLRCNSRCNRPRVDLPRGCYPPSRIWKAQPRLTRPYSCPWPRRWGRFSVAVQASRSEQSLWRDWVTHMASTRRDQNRLMTGSHESCITCSFMTSHSKSCVHGKPKGLTHCCETIVLGLSLDFYTSMNGKQHRVRTKRPSAKWHFGRGHQ